MDKRNHLFLIAYVFLLATFTGCVQEQHSKTVTFLVDMTHCKNVEGVSLIGEFSSPPWSERFPMTDTNGDGIYETTLKDTTAVSQMEFKFVRESGEYELVNQPNRVLEFRYMPENIVYETVFNISKGKQSLRP